VGVPLVLRRERALAWFPGVILPPRAAIWLRNAANHMARSLSNPADAADVRLHPSQFCNKTVIVLIVHCRMARTGLRWSLDELARQSGVSRRTIARFELGGRVSAETLEALRNTFENAGAKFIEADQLVGVVLRNEMQ
jgi:DNA-binding XRE family transcriptional regulator